MRVLLKYARYGSASYLSHLDMQRAFARILRRSLLPVSYSQGFNPHILMSFASPLSVGYETDGDYMEFRLEENISAENIRLAVSDVLPDNIEVCFVGILSDSSKKLMSLNSSAEYEVVFEHEVEKQWDDFRNSTSCITLDRKGKEINARSFVIDGHADGNILTLHLKNSSESSLNPAVIAGIFAEDEEKVFYKRLECYAKTACGEAPFSELVEKA